MKKKIILASLCALMLVPLGACDLGGDSSSSDGTVDSSGVTVQHDYVKQEAVSATCETAGNEEYYTCNECDGIFDKDKNAIDGIPTVAALGHEYVLAAAKDGTCATKGEVAHYTCEDCDKLFDLTQQEITSVEGDYDYANHKSQTVLAAQTQPTKLAYKVGEAFDPTGMVVTYKCGDCEGETVDNQFLTYTYETEGATNFTLGNTKITVSYNGLSFEVTVTVEKAQAVISGVEETYTASCGVAPVIEATCNLPDADIVVEYYEDGQKVEAADMVAGKTYTAKVFVAETDAVLGAEVTASVNIQHAYAWVADEADENKLIYKCGCGDTKDYYALNNQVLYVDDADMSVDLSKLVQGTENYSVKSVQQIQLLNNNEKVAIEGVNADMVYTFDKDLYEKTAFDVAEDGTVTYYTPYELALAVTYTVDGADCEIVYVVKYVDKVIRTAADLAAVMYKGDHGLTIDGVAHPATTIKGQYVLVGDIDATNLVIDSKVCHIAEGGFCGVLEGNGYTISNLTIPAGCNGLFGALGYNAKIQNVVFDNVTVIPENVTPNAGTYVFAYAIRNAKLSNVTVNFSEKSNAFKLCNEINDCELENVNVTISKGETPYFAANNTNIEAITYDYLTQYTVTFDTDGGNEIAPVAVTVNKKLVAPETPVKTSEEYDYVFLGWYLGEDEWDLNTPVTEDIELVAKWQERAKVTAEEVTAKIAVLPDSVTMPDNIYFVSRILEAKEAYDNLKEELKADVTNVAKLEGLLANIKGYETVYKQNAAGVNVVPSHVPNYTSTIGGTATTRTDDLCGNVLTVTPDAGGKAAVQFKDFPSVSKYTKIYVCVKVIGDSCNVYMSDGIGGDGWGNDYKNNWSMDGYWANSGNWMIMSVDVLSGIIASDWAIGLRTDKTDIAFEIADIIGYQDPLKATGLTFGNFAATETTNEYGVVYNFTQGWASDSDLGAFNTNALSNTLPEGYESLCFWIYNPNETDVEFKVLGDMNGWNPTGDYVTSLTAKAWTKVVLTPEIIEQGKSGMWFVAVTSGASTAGWQISAIFAEIAA